MSLEEKKHILIVDDDDRIRSLLVRYLEKHNCIVMSAENAQHAEDILRDFIFDILILDVMMPVKNGFDFAREVRKNSDVPILFLTAKTELSDKADGFESGADDYLSKPFEPEELMMRIDAILRRRGLNLEKEEVFTIGKWTYNRMRMDLVSEKETLRLTDVEKSLLDVFLSRPDHIFSREILAGRLGVDGNDRTIDVQVTRLRKKIEDDTKQPRFLQTVRGKGYVLHLE